MVFSTDPGCAGSLASVETVLCERQYITRRRNYDLGRLLVDPNLPLLGVQDLSLDRLAHTYPEPTQLIEAMIQASNDSGQASKGKLNSQ